MNVKKPLMIAGIASTVALGGVAGGGIVSAATPSNGTSDSQSSLVNAIASKFHLNKNDVQAVVDQNRQTHEAERQQRFEARLDQAVKDDKITSSQKEEILAKQKEVQSYMESIKDKSPEERHQLMKTKFDELRAWAKANHIPPQYLGGGHGGPGSSRGMRPDRSDK